MANCLPIAIFCIARPPNEITRINLSGLKKGKKTEATSKGCLIKNRFLSSDWNNPKSRSIANANQQTH
jgi:hypothetical protein